MIRCAVMIQDNLRFPRGLTFKGAAGVVLFNWAGCSFFQLLRDPHLPPALPPVPISWPKRVEFHLRRPTCLTCAGEHGF